MAAHPGPGRQDAGDAAGRPAGDPAVVLSFLHALFAGTSGWIELRCFSSGKERTGAASYWFETVEALTASLPEIRAFAERRGLTASLGVLPRQSRSGRAADTSPGRAAWADLDFKAVAEAEARRRIDGLGARRPSVVISSGHGLHLYWLMRDGVEPAVLVSLCRRLGAVLGADACHDAGRVLRMPGTLNLKECWEGDSYRFDATKARPCFLESMDTSRLFDPGDFADLPEPPPSVPRARSARVNRTIGDLPAPVRELITRDTRLAALWYSKGKSQGDTSNSGYDASFALALARKGVIDPDTLDAAVAARPVTGATIARCHRAIRRTVDWALSRVVKEQGAPEPPPDGWFERFLVDVEEGRRSRADLGRVLAGTSRFVQMPQRHLLAVMLGGSVSGGWARGVLCPRCANSSVGWAIPPGGQARCAVCASRWTLEKLCVVCGVDVLATMSPMFADS